MIDFLSTLPVWQLWLLGALMLFALEIFTPGFILACFGVGALVAVPVTLLHGSWLVQVIPMMLRRGWMPLSVGESY